MEASESRLSTNSARTWMSAWFFFHLRRIFPFLSGCRLLSHRSIDPFGFVFSFGIGRMGLDGWMDGWMGWQINLMMMNYDDGDGDVDVGGWEMGAMEMAVCQA